jgi:hypothetical protein
MLAPGHKTSESTAQTNARILAQLRAHPERHEGDRLSEAKVPAISP